MDLTDYTLDIVILGPNKDIHVQPCTVISTSEGTASVLLDEAAYSILGEYQAQFRTYKGTETNITDKFYYEAIDALPTS